MDKYALKFIDEEKGIVEGLIAPYHGPLDGKDLESEYFDQETDFRSPRYDGTAVKSLPMKFHHGMDPVLGDQDIGEITEIVPTKLGLWGRGILNKANDYIEDIKTLVKMGKLKFSSGADDKDVVKAEDGHIKAWPLKEASLTYRAANPMQPIPSIKAFVGSLKAETTAIEAEAQKLAEQFNVPVSEVMDGMKEEMEHKDVTGGDPITTAKLVEAHLKEDPHYYVKLRDAMAAKAFDESKHPRADNGEFGQGSGGGNKPIAEKPKGKLFATAAGEYDRDRNVEILKNRGYTVHVEEVENAHVMEGADQMRKVPGKVYRIYGSKENNESTEAKAMEDPKKETPAQETAESPAEEKHETPQQEIEEKEEKKSRKSKAMKAIKDTGVELPEPVVDALLALHDSIEEIIPGVCEMEEDTEPVQEPNEPAPAASQPGVGQGMGAENHSEPPKEAAKSTKSVAVVAIADVDRMITEALAKQETAMKALIAEKDESVKSLVEEATKSLREQVAELQSQPAAGGPIRKVTPVENPKMDTTTPKATRAQAIKALLDDPDLDPSLRISLSREDAADSLNSIFERGPKAPR